MRRVTALLGAAAVVLWATSAFAQAKPNFAGTWVREAPAGGAAAGGGGGGRGGGGGGWGNEPTITQDATTLTVKWMAGREGTTPNERTYKLDGSESKNMVARGGGEPMAIVSKATWEGSKLVIKTTTQAGEQTMAVSLEGGNLVIETTNPGREGGAPTTNKAVYKKK
jgi:hypothetical protein